MRRIFGIESRLTVQSLRILFVTPVSPYGQSAGGQQRSRLLLSALQQLGAVDVVILQRGSGRHASWERVGPNAVRVTTRRTGWFGLTHDNALLSILAESLPQPVDSYDLVVSRYLWPIAELGRSVAVPLVADLDDSSYRFALASLLWPKNWLAYLHKRASSFAAKAVRSRLSAALFVSERDRKAAKLIQTPSIVLHNVSPMPTVAHTRHPDGKTIMFVGSMWYGPNAHAVDWFLHKVWPQLRTQFGSLRLIVAGAANGKQLSRWSSVPGVLAEGYVDDLTAYYAAASIVVVPVWSGGGSNIKLLEALAHGCPCVSSDFAHSPFAAHLVDERDLLVASSAKTFALACARLLQDPTYGERLANAGQVQVEKYFSAESFTQDAVRFFRGVLNLG